MKTKMLFTIYMLFAVCKIFAQPPVDLENKYWNYRDRQKKYFTQIGPAPGQGQISAGVGSNWSRSDTVRIINGKKVKIQPWDTKVYGGAIGFGDAMVDHGYYLAALASEFRVLTLEGKRNTERFKNLVTEIYFALEAIDRVDRNAEPYLTNNKTAAKLNGFFIRSDHDQYYMKRFNQVPNQEMMNLISGGASGPYLTKIDTSNNTLQVFGPDSFRMKIYNDGNIGVPTRWVGGPGNFGTSYNWGNEMSQDQCYGLFLGITCIKSWIESSFAWSPDTLLYEKRNYHDWIKKITARITYYMSREFDDRVKSGDISDIFYVLLDAKKKKYQNLQNYCKDVSDFPYGGDSLVYHAIPDTLYKTVLDTNGAFLKYDTVLSYYDTLYDGKVSKTPFTNSYLRSCNLWEEAVKQYDRGKWYKATFRKSNYIITNPVRNHKEVTRGHLALPFGYPIKEFAKYITGVDTLPDPQARLTAVTTGERIAADALWVAKIIAEVSTFTGAVEVVGIEIDGVIYYVQQTVIKTIGRKFAVAAIQAFTFIAPGFLSNLSGKENAQSLSAVLSKLHSHCPLLSPSPDMISLCLVGRFIEVHNGNYWRDVFNEFGKSDVLMEALRGRHTANMVHNMALASRAWNHAAFRDWAAELNFPISELFYAKLHGGTPSYSRLYYLNILNKAQCEGPFHLGTTDGSTKVAAYKFCQPWGSDNAFLKFNLEDSTLWAGAGNGLDYVLLYNLFKMAEMEDWNYDTYKRNFDSKSNCPCFNYPCKPKEGLVRSIVEKFELKNDTIDGNVYHEMMFMPDFNINGYEYKCKPVQEEYKLLNVRIPEYLGHDLKVYSTNSGNHGKLRVYQDLTVCNSVLEIGQNGDLIIQENNKNDFPSLLIVNENSTLKLRETGIIYINNNCKLILEEGSNFEFEKGARIVLNGPNAILEIKGNLKLGTGAVFQVEEGTNGKGTVIFECYSKLVPRYKRVNAYIPKDSLYKWVYSSSIYADSSNKMVFTNKTTSQNGFLALEVRGNLGLTTPWNLGKFEIRNCRVNFGPESRIVSHANNTIIDSVDFYGHYTGHANSNFDYKRTSMGVHILGKKNLVRHCNFKDCYQALKIFNVGNYYPLVMEDVNFYNCVKAILNDAGSIKYKNGYINGDAPIQRFAGIEGIATQGKTDIQNVQIVVPDYQWMSNVTYKFKPLEYCTALKYHGAGQIYPFRSTFSQATKGVELDQSLIRPVCSKIELNKLQVSFANYASFNAVDHTMNEIWFNAASSGQLQKEKTFFGHHKNTFLLNNAQNRIAGSYGSTAADHFININLRPDHTSVASSSNDAYYPNAQLGIFAKNNLWDIWNGAYNDIHAWNPTSSSTVQPNVTLQGVRSTGQTYYDLLTKDHINYTQFTDSNAFYCAYYDNHNGWYPFPYTPPTNLSDQCFFKEPHGTEDETIKTVLFLLPKLKDELYTAGEYTNLFNNVKAKLDTNIADSFLIPVQLFYNDFQALYREIKFDENIDESNRVNVESQYYSQLVDIQSKLIDRCEAAEDVWRFMRLELHRDLALIHRTFDQRVTGINHLNSVMSSFPNPQDQEILQSWVCILEREQMYLDTLIPYDSVYLYKCVPNYYFTDSTLIYNQVGFDPWLYNNNQEDPGNYSPAPLKQTEKAPEKQAENDKLQLFPNPAENAFTVVFTKPMQQIKVYDNAGRIINTYQLNDKNSININATALARGIYIVEAQSRGKRYVKRLVINK